MPHPERASDALLGSTDGVVLLRSLLAGGRGAARSRPGRGVPARRARGHVAGVSGWRRAPSADAKARENAMYFIHSCLDFNHPDEAEFWRSGADALRSVVGAVRSARCPGPSACWRSGAASVA